MGLQDLVKWIDNSSLSKCQLEVLSLQGNKLNDRFTVDLVESLIRANPPIKEINLAHNLIGDQGAVSLAEIISTHYHLRTVKIGWNKIKGKGGIALADAIKESQKVVFFEASFNAFGFKRDGEFGKRMGEACNNKILRHLDISYNSMDAKDCEAFAEQIHENHSLWGLHMMGNDCLVDSMGFVKAGHRNMKESRDILYSPIQDGLSFLMKSPTNKFSKIMSYQNCWVCEGWSERKFEWKMGISGSILKEPVYIHFDFDTYTPWLLEKDPEDEIYFIYKMVPPGKSHYFYSFGGENGEADFSKEQLSYKPS